MAATDLISKLETVSPLTAPAHVASLAFHPSCLQSSLLFLGHSCQLHLNPFQLQQCTPCAPPGSGLSKQISSRIISEPNFVCSKIYTPFHALGLRGKPCISSSFQSLGNMLFLCDLSLKKITSQLPNLYSKTDSGRGPRGNDSSPTPQEEHRAQ